MPILIIELSIKEKGGPQMSKEEKNEVVKAAPRQVSLTASQDFTNSLVLKLEKGNKEIGEKYSEYGKRCVINAIAGLLTVCKQNNISTDELDMTSLQLQLQNIGFTELNYATSPAEVYFDLRKVWVTKEDGSKVQRYSVTIKPQGVGNEKLVRKFGVNLKELYSAWLVRECDEFTYPMWNGDKITPPTWKIKGTSGKVVLVVYVVKKTTGECEYLMADRESVKANLIAQIRQNAMHADMFKVEKTNSKNAKYTITDTEARDKFYAKVDKDFEGKTLDECLKMEEYKDFINPTYTSGGSMEAMVIRKMRNNALKNYPKEYDTTLISEKVMNMWEDKDDTVMESAPIIKKDAAKIVDAQVEEVGDETPSDFDVDENGVIHEEEPKEENPTPKEEVKEEEKEAEEVPSSDTGDGEPNPEDMF